MDHGIQGRHVSVGRQNGSSVGKFERLERKEQRIRPVAYHDRVRHTQILREHLLKAPDLRPVIGDLAGSQQTGDAVQTSIIDFKVRTNARNDFVRNFAAHVMGWNWMMENCYDLAVPASSANPRGRLQEASCPGDSAPRAKSGVGKSSLCMQLMIARPRPHRLRLSTIRN
jgi:hypothetical protein